MIAQHRLLSAAIVTALAAPPALAQTASPPTPTATMLDTVIVTGTRVAGRTVAESS